VDNIKTALREIGWGSVWIGLVWLRIGTSGAEFHKIMGNSSEAAQLTAFQGECSMQLVQL
jgi:hypothetical protein